MQLSQKAGDDSFVLQSEDILRRLCTGVVSIQSP